MTRYQPRSLEPLPTDAKRPPGEHITFPEVAWPEAVTEPPPPMQPARPSDVRAAPACGAPGVHVSIVDNSALHRPVSATPVIMPIGMIEPRPSLAPWVFWAIVMLSFACVLARAGGWL